MRRKASHDPGRSEELDLAPGPNLLLQVTSGAGEVQTGCMTSPQVQIPEALGPASETSGGGLSYGVPGLRAGPMPVPSREERAARLAEFDQVAAHCPCAPIPDAVLIPLRQLVA